MNAPKNARVGLIVFVVCYGLLSLFLATINIDLSTGSSVERNLNILSLAGPPAALLHGKSFVWFYIVGSLALVIPVIKVFLANSRVGRITAAVFLLLIWILFGFAGVRSPLI